MQRIRPPCARVALRRKEQLLNISISKTTIADSVAEQIQQLIANKMLHAGDTLPSQRELAEQLNVGRPAVREALKRLETMGIVRVSHGKKTVVEKLDINTFIGSASKVLELTSVDVLQLLEAKEIIETRCIELATERGTEEQFDEMRRYLDQMKEFREQPSNHAEADFLFHAAIVKAADNPIIIEIMTLIGRMIERAIEETAIEDDLEGRDRAMEYHKRLYEAVRNREPETAVTVLHQHSHESRSRYEKISRRHHL